MKQNITLKSRLVLEVSWLVPILQEVGSGRELSHNSVALSADVLVVVDQLPKSVGVKQESYGLLNGEYLLMVKGSKQNAQNLCCFLCCVN
jgi:hypothetical protein